MWEFRSFHDKDSLNVYIMQEVEKKKTMEAQEREEVEPAAEDKVESSVQNEGSLEKQTCEDEQQQRQQPDEKDDKFVSKGKF